MSKITYRQAQAKDIGTLIALRLKFLQAVNGSAEQEVLDAITQQLREYFTSNLDKTFFAVLGYGDDEERGEALCAAFLVIMEKPANYNFTTGKTGLVLNVYTSPKHKNISIVREAMEQIIEIAKAQNLTMIEISATEAEEKVCKALGFKVKKSKFSEMALRLG